MFASQFTFPSALVPVGMVKTVLMKCLNFVCQVRSILKKNGNKYSVFSHFSFRVSNSFSLTTRIQLPYKINAMAFPLKACNSSQCSFFAAKGVPID